MIVTLELKPGAAASEAWLTEHLGIGRTPIREALNRLAKEHLVVILPQRGVVISPLDEGVQMQLLEAWRELSRLSAQNAASHATSVERSQFIDTAVALDTAANGCEARHSFLNPAMAHFSPTCMTCTSEPSGCSEAFLYLDDELSSLLATACGNDFVTEATKMIFLHFRRFWNAYYREAADLPRFARLQAELANAIARGNKTEASDASDHLMDYLGEFIRATVTERSSI